MVQYPCRGCIYFKVCGESTRTTPCYGRKTKSEAKKSYPAEGRYYNYT